MLQDKSSTWRRDAAQALGEIGDARAVGPLLVALGEVGESGVDGVFAKLSVRGAAARALGRNRQIPVPWSLWWLRLRTRMSRCAKDAVEALGRIGDPRALEPLVAMLTDADEGVRGAAVEALESMGWEPPGRGPTRAAVAWRRGGSGGCGWRWGPRGWIPRWPPLKARRAGCERDAALALGRIGDARAVGPLLSALHHRDTTVRWAAAQALGELGDTRAVEPLVVLLGDPHHDVQRAAAQALTGLGDARAHRVTHGPGHGLPATLVEGRDFWTRSSP